MAVHGAGGEETQQARRKQRLVERQIESNCPEQEESWDVGLAAPRSVKSKICLELAHLHVKRSWQQLL